MNAFKFSESIEINADPGTVFDYTQDYGKRLSWDTFLMEARLLNATQPDKGVKAWCVSKKGLGMETEYVSFHPPKVTAIKMTKGPWMFKDFAASWNFKTSTPHKTMVIFIYSFSLRFPFSLVGFFIKMTLQRDVRQRLVDLRNKFEYQGKTMIDE